MKILTDNRYIGTLERKIAVAVNQNLFQAEGEQYLCMKKSMDTFVEEIAKAVRRHMSESINENFS
jgi:hypothetical protein